MMSIIQNIKRIRQSKGWTHDEIADKLNVSTSTWNKIENGHVELKISVLEKIASILEVPIEALVRSPQESGDFYDVLKGGGNWLDRLKDIEKRSEEAARCREELFNAQKKIIELQEKLLQERGK